LAEEAYPLRRAFAFVILGVAPVGCAQHDDLFDQAGAQEVAHAGEASIAGFLDPHAE
jgi:hypothetical protein